VLQLSGGRRWGHGHGSSTASGARKFLRLPPRCHRLTWPPPDGHCIPFRTSLLGLAATCAVSRYAAGLALHGESEKRGLRTARGEQGHGPRRAVRAGERRLRLVCDTLRGPALARCSIGKPPLQNRFELSLMLSAASPQPPLPHPGWLAVRPGRFQERRVVERATRRGKGWVGQLCYRFRFQAALLWDRRRVDVNNSWAPRAHAHSHTHAVRGEKGVASSWDVGGGVATS
jgi:hypothetical protein